MTSNIQLEAPSLQRIESYLSFITEMNDAGEKIWEANVPGAAETNAQFIERLLRAETSPNPGLVAETTCWATFGHEVVGRIALRHSLNKNLEEFGGHIGYEVRPTSRKKGIATKMLKLILETPKAQEIGRLLLTCAPDNTASNKTIQNNGGILTKTAYVERVQRHTNYYWIEL